MGRLSRAEIKFVFLWFDQVLFDPMILDDHIIQRTYVSIFGLEPIRRSDALAVTDVMVPYDAIVGRKAAEEFVEHQRRTYDENGGTFAQKNVGALGRAHHATV